MNKHADQETIIGKMLRTTTKATKIEVGSCTQFFQLDYSAYGILPANSYTNTNETLGANDIMIMDAYVALECSKSSLQKINRYRINLQVMTLQDVKALGPSRWNKVYKACELVYYNLTLQWPNQTRPSNSCTQLRRQAFCRIKELHPRPPITLHSIKKKTGCGFMTLSYALSIKRWALYEGNESEQIEEAENKPNLYSTMSAMLYNYL